MTIFLWLAFLVPTLLASSTWAWRRAAWVRWTPSVAAASLTACGVALVAGHSLGQVSFAVFDLLRVDALSAYMVLVVGLVALVSTLAAPTRRPDGWFSGLMCCFLASMTVAVLADNLGVVWLAIEATTIATAFLVGYGGGRNALEAAWKYVVLGSVGVAIALLGLVFVFAAAAEPGPASLAWSALMANPHLHGGLAKVGLALTALGFATKAGLAPMHSWLPDAHSQAPAQVSGLMSGVLLSVAFYAILRVKAVSDVVVGPAFLQHLLLVGGLASLLVAAALMLTQRNYKRLLAYSSIEHMGILAVGAAIGGPLAMAAVLVHIVAHGLTKASMFVVAGRILAVTGSARVDDVRGLLTSHPGLAKAWLVGAASLAGFPPSALFLTEVALVVAGFQRGLGWAVLAMMVLLLLVFAALARHSLPMTLGAGSGAGGGVSTSTVPDPTPWAQRWVVWVAFAAVAGMALAAPWRGVLEAAARVAGGH